MTHGQEPACVGCNSEEPDTLCDRCANGVCHQCAIEADGETVCPWCKSDGE